VEDASVTVRLLTNREGKKAHPSGAKTQLILLSFYVRAKARTLQNIKLFIQV
jgi:hypothetical protein